MGVGGVLMVSYLALFAGLTIHQAAATSLFSFLFTGILGTWLYQRRGSIDWRITIPVCVAAAFFGFLGAAVAAMIDPRPLAIVIALIIVVAGVYVLFPARPHGQPRNGPPAPEIAARRCSAPPRASARASPARADRSSPCR